MVKRKQLPKIKIDTSKLIELAKIVVSHPVTFGLAIMTGSALTMAALAASDRSGNQRARDINYQLGGLYSGAQGIATAAVVVPVIVSGLQTVAAFAKPTPK